MTAPYAPQQPQPQQQRPGPDGLAASLFGKSGLATNPLFAAGITLMDQPGGPGGLTAALQAGMQAQQMREQAIAEEEHAALQERIRERLLASKDDPRSLLAAAREMIAYGDVDGAKSLLDLAKAYSAMQEGVETMVVGSEKLGFKLIDKRTGRLIADLYAPVAPEDESFTIKEIADLKNTAVDDWRTDATTQNFDVLASSMQVIRDNTTAALAGDKEAQEQLLAAAFRIKNPQMARGATDEVIAGMGEKGSLPGQFQSAWERLVKDRLLPGEVNDWIRVAEATVRGQIQLHDAARDVVVRRQDPRIGLTHENLLDYFRFERIKLPGVSPERATGLDRIMQKGKR
jgi:hypothetical protein